MVGIGYQEDLQQEHGIKRSGRRVDVFGTLSFKSPEIQLEVAGLQSLDI